MKRILILSLCLLSLSLPQQALALLITADATGSDSLRVNDFWGFKFERGSGFIKSVSFDVSGISAGTYFDLRVDPGASYTPSGFPITDNSKSNVAASNITWSRDKRLSSSGETTNANLYRRVKMTFDQNTCGVRCSVRFRADTDPLNINGAGHAGTIFTVVFENGRRYTGIFRNTSFKHTSGNNISQSSVNVVPLPAAAWLFISALGGLLAIRRNKACAPDSPRPDINNINTVS